MADGPAAHEISVPETLTLLDTKFKSFAEAVASGRYAFWLGSGISRDRFPMLDDLIVKVLEYLRERSDSSREDCPYLKALDRALTMAGLSSEDKTFINFAQNAEMWPQIGLLKSRLSSQYEKFLNIRVGDERNDILVWEGVDVVGTYADLDQEPDAEHLCIAVLIREGIIDEIASANWDGLVEKAYAAISGGGDSLAVCVKSDDLQQAAQKPKLVKFHGCAIRAKQDPDQYRDLIVARSAQLHDWGKNDATKGVKSHLVSVIGERPTLMLGLSAQDTNIKELFTQARDVLNWPWPGDQPSYIFSEDKLGGSQDDLLELVYKDAYDGPQRAIISESSVIRAYAKPLLLALLLYVYSAKMRRLARMAGLPDCAAFGAWIDEGLNTVRDAIAGADNCDRLHITEVLIKEVSRTRTLLSSGDYDAASGRYEPIKEGNIGLIEGDIDTLNSGLPEACVAASILGHGFKDGIWSFRCIDDSSPGRAVGVVDVKGNGSPVFMAANGHAAGKLFVDSALDDTMDAILIHSQEIMPRMARSPSMQRERTGEPRLREVSVKSLMKDCSTPHELYERFRMDAAL